MAGTNPEENHTILKNLVAGTNPEKKITSILGKDQSILWNEYP